MNWIARGLMLFSMSALLLSCGSDARVELFNGSDLDNWVIFVSSDELAPEELFWVEDGLIATTGVPHGYIRTRETYENYSLHVEWRWLEKPTNSGVLLHVQEPDMIWPLAIECQLMHEHAGDLVLIGKGAGATVKDSTYLITSEENRYAVIPKFEKVSEKPAGEWNTYEITSVNGELEVWVNGVLQHEASELTLTRGHILLQSEGSPMQFRNIYLEKH